eukprot:14040717-Alexandrium_andersonii.AAC.1
MDDILFTGSAVGDEGKCQGFWTIFTGCRGKASCRQTPLIDVFQLYITGDNILIWSVFSLGFIALDEVSVAQVGKE